ncbi:30S ribosomal protein S4 [Patescibacteria group bacterium]|nr:30S ribosomal protein S4 [Patescibacteria group bacterium]
MIYEQCKTCRRLGQKLFLKGERCLSAKCAMVKRAYAPGPQKKKRGRSFSEYKKSLDEKQALKKWYGVSERQFKRYVQECLAKMGRVEDVSAELIKRLEKRLDNTVFRLGFAKSRAHARQLVSHGYFLVNKKPMNIVSYEVKKNDMISLKENKKKKEVLRDAAIVLKKQESPVWLQFSKEKLEAKIVGEPSLDEVKPPAEISLIFEFYSR